MADALKFMIEFIDKVTRPASVASAAVSRLEANLSKLRAAVADVAALPQLKFPSVGGTASKATKTRDPFATGAANNAGLDKLAAKAEKARLAQEKADKRVADKAVREADRATKAKEKAADKAAAADKKAFEKGMKAQDRAVKQQEKAAALAKKAAEKTNAGAFQKAFAGASDSAAGFEVMGSSLGALLNPVTIATGAVLALTAALAGLAAGLFKGAELALAASEAKNDTLDMLEAMLGSAEAAQRANDAIEDVTRNTAVSQAAVREMAGSLTAAGVTNEAMLLDAVKAIAQTESVLKGAGAKIQNIVEKAAATGKFEISTKQLVGTGVQLSVLYQELAARTGKGVKEIEKELKDGKISAETGIAALTKVLDKKFGAVAAKQALDLGAQLQRARDNFSRLFEDVNTGPFLEALSKMLSVFDQSTVSGQALHEIVTKVFDGLFEAATAVLPYITIGMKGIVLIALKVWNAFRPLAAAISKAFGGENATGPESFSDAMISIADAVGSLTEKFVGLLTQKGVWDSFVFGIEVAARVVSDLWAVMTFLAGAFFAVEEAILSALGWLAEFNTAVVQVGADIMTGLIQVLSDPTRLLEVVSRLATSALGKFKSVFRMGSPSRVMMDMGGFITEGLAMGIDKGSKAVNDNMGNVVSLDDAREKAQAGAAPIAAAGAKGGSSTSLQITFSEGAIQINGSNMSVEEVRELFPDVVADALERALLSQGGGAKVA